MFCRSGLAKEPNPLQGAFQPEQLSAEVGSTVTLVLVFEPLREFAKVKLSLTVPPGLQLVRGKTTTELTDLKPDKKTEVTYVFRLTKPGEQELWARAVVQGLSATEFIAQSYLVIVNPVEKSDDYRIEEDAHGRKIRVHEVP